MKNLTSIMALAALYAGLVSARALPAAGNNVAVHVPHKIGEIPTCINDLSNVDRYWQVGSKWPQET